MMSRIPHSRTKAIAVFVSLLLVSLVLAGCSFRNPYSTGSFQRGAYFHEQGKHYEASEALDAFLRRSPTDSLAASAQLLKAKSCMEMKEYPLAAVELRILQQDYPTSEFVVEAGYLEGLAYLSQARRIQTDISGAFEAREHFLRFVTEYPGSDYQDRILGHLQDISDMVVRKGLGGIEVFRQRGRHAAVGVVLDDLLGREPTSALIPEVLWERAATAKKLDDIGTERVMLQRLATEYPESDFAARAEGRLAELATDSTTPEESSTPNEPAPEP